ncbi:MAG: PaaI family thioesterase [Pseudomonadota bacterium]
MSDSVTDPTRAEALQSIFNRIPMVQTIGMQCDVKGDDMVAILPYQDKLIGNFTIKALHGGAIGTFLEFTAVAQLFLDTDTPRPARPINITVDYLRQGRATDLFARADVTKLGRRIASVRVEAWQSQRDKPVAALLGHFLLDRGS